MTDSEYKLFRKPAKRSGLKINQIENGKMIVKGKYEGGRCYDQISDGKNLQAKRRKGKKQEMQEGMKFDKMIR